MSEKTLEELAKEQEVKPIENIDDLAADFWPDDDIDEFIVAIRQWRSGEPA